MPFNSGVLCIIINLYLDGKCLIDNDYSGWIYNNSVTYFNTSVVCSLFGLGELSYNNMADSKLSVVLV